MKQTLKKALSMLMAAAILCSFAVIPASAAGTVTIGLENGRWDGDKYTVDVVASGDDFGVASVEIDVKFDPSVLTWVSNDVGYSNGVLASVQGGNTVHAAGASANDVPSVGGKLVLVGLTFQVAADAETQDTNLEVVVDDAMFENANFEGYDMTAASPLPVHVTGQPPMLETLTLDESTVTVDGTDLTVNASAKSTKGATINGAVDWKIEPTSGDVSISGGVITVSGSAKPATYTVTATPKTGEARGDAVSAPLTVTRANERKVVTVEGPASITVPKAGQPNSTAQYKAMVSNQFGDAPEEASAEWSVSVARGVSIDVATGIVTVTSEAAPKTSFTVTATVGEVSSEQTRINLVEIDVKPDLKNNGNVVYGDTWAQIVTGVTAKLGEETVPGTFTVANANVRPTVGANRTTNVTFKSTDGVYEVTVPVTVNVAKRAITITLPAQEVEYDGKEHTSPNVEYTGAEVVDGATLVCVPVEAVTKTAAGTYKVEYTCESDNYIVTVKGGDFVINKKLMDLDSDNVVNKITLGGLTLTQKEDGTLGLTVPSGTKESDLLKELRSANKDLVFSVSDDEGKIYEFTIEDWVLVEDEFNSKGYNTFAPVLAGVDAASDAFLENHQPNVPNVVIRVSSTGGSGGSGSGGNSSSSYWGDRGNQTINLTPMSIFTDVPDGYTFQTDIMWVYYRGVMKGTSATTFSPYSNTNRQQLWMVLGRISGSNPGDMATARAWAINTGVSDGTNATGSLTRQQMVTMLYRWAQSKGYTGVTTGSISGYADASSVASYARDAMNWAVGNGIIHGSGNTLMPNGTATRAQFAAIMHRFCEKFGV